MKQPLTLRMVLRRWMSGIAFDMHGRDPGQETIRSLTDAATHSLPPRQTKSYAVPLRLPERRPRGSGVWV